MECPRNTFSGKHIWRDFGFGPVCRYCSVKSGAIGTDESAPVENRQVKPPPLARNTDPSTSKQAGEDMAGSKRQYGYKALAIGALTAQNGQTAGEIADYLGLRHEQIWRRVSDLKNDGAIEAHGTRVWHGSNKAQEVWWLTGTWEG